MISVFQPNSIARRLAISATFGIIVFWLAAVAIAGYIFQHELEEAFDESLRQAAIRLLPLAQHDLREREDGAEYLIEETADQEATFSYFIFDPVGRAVVFSENQANANLVLPQSPGFSTLNGVRLFTHADVKTGFSIVVTERADHRRDALWESIGGLLLPLGAFVPLVLIGVALAIRKAMEPVEALRLDIARRSSHDLSPLSSAGQPFELAPIAHEVAGLMERLRLALEAERTFAANSAHELRTPLAGALAQVQRLSIEIGNGPSRERLDEVSFSLRHLSDLSEKLLQLSRLEAGFARSDEIVKLGPALDLMIQDYRSSSKNKNELVVHNDEKFQLQGRITQDAFAIVIRNLMDNASAHGLAHTPIEFHVMSNSKFRVANQCAIIPPNVLSRIGEPFHRGESTAKGTGLGLSIVKSVIKQCDGSLSLNSPATGSDSGFEAVIDLTPKAPTNS